MHHTTRTYTRASNSSMVRGFARVCDWLASLLLAKRNCPKIPARNPQRAILSAKFLARLGLSTVEPQKDHRREALSCLRTTLTGPDEPYNQIEKERAGTVILEFGATHFEVFICKPRELLTFPPRRYDHPSHRCEGVSAFICRIRTMNCSEVATPRWKI